MNYRLNRRRVPQGVVDQAFVNRAPHAGAQNSANRAAQRLGDFCLRTPIFIEPQDAIAIEDQARPAADAAFAPGARQPGTPPPAPQPAEPETEDQMHARLLSGFLFGADDTRMIRGPFVSGRRLRALAAAQVMPMPGTVMSISAPSPGRLGELAAIARAEAGDKPSRTAPEGPGAAECVSDKSSALLSAGMPSRPLETAPEPSGERP